MSPFVGSIRMIDKDTAEGMIMGYALSSVKKVADPTVDPPPWAQPPEIKFISVISGRFVFTGPDTMEADWTNTVYPPSPDGLPHVPDGQDPPVPIPGDKLYFNRVPFIPYVPPVG